MSFSGLLRFAGTRSRSGSGTLADRIDALLPQTQCQQCGYSGCRPYAEAIARGEADINQCPPGGQAGIRALARLLGREPKPLDPAHGTEKTGETVAWIDETLCIGCTKCIQACPVDAIVGARRQMHTVLREPCTGCELCLAPCPVDCIHMVPAPREAAGWLPALLPGLDARRRRHRADLSRERYRFRQERLERERRDKEERRRQKKAALRGGRGARVSEGEKKAAIAAALAKARQRQGQRRTAQGASGTGVEPDRGGGTGASG